MVKQSWLGEGRERQYTQRAEDLRTGQQMQSIVEEDMLLKDRPRSVHGVSDSGGQTKSRPGLQPI